MDDQEFIKRMKDRIAELAVSASAVRNQGASGIPDAARNYLKTIDLRKFRTSTIGKFKDNLNRTTNILRIRLPRGAKNWGTARKIINLYLRDILYNHYLCKHFKFDKIEDWLEVPLDSYVARGIRREINDNSVPKWVNIKGLTISDNNKFQDAAYKIAKQKKVARVHLDLLYWRNK